MRIGGGVIINELQNGKLDISQPDLPDYKFFCFNGEPEILLYCTDRHDGTSKWDFFDMQLKRLPFKAKHHNTTDAVLEYSSSFDEMKNICRKIAKGIPYVSVDLYCLNEKVYFGETTFYSGSGHIRFEPAKADKTIGQLLKLPLKYGK